MTKKQIFEFPLFSSSFFCHIVTYWRYHKKNVAISSLCVYGFLWKVEKGIKIYSFMACKKRKIRERKIKFGRMRNSADNFFLENFLFKLKTVPPFFLFPIFSKSIGRREKKVINATIFSIEDCFYGSKLYECALFCVPMETRNLWAFLFTTDRAQQNDKTKKKAEKKCE